MGNSSGKGRMRTVAVVALLGLLGGILAAAGGPAYAQGAAQTFEVQVGGNDTGVPLFGAPPDAPAPNIVTQAFFPNPLIIRAGDTVHWKFVDFHSVTFNNNRDPRPLFVPGTAPGELVGGPGLFPEGPTGANAVFDPTRRNSSGAPLGPDLFQAGYRLTFNTPGIFGYVCDIHPGMRGEVEVREAGATLPETPAQAKTRGQLTMGALMTKMRAGVAGVRSASGGTVHTALAGLGDPFGASSLRFINGDKTIRRGDTVVWTMPDPFEIHTVTFLSGAPPPPFIEPRPQPQGPPLLVVPANIPAPSGGDTYTGQGMAHSGIMEPGSSYVLRFDAAPGRYDYLCLVHPFMKGTITVSG